MIQNKKQPAQTMLLCVCTCLRIHTYITLHSIPFHSIPYIHTLITYIHTYIHAYIHPSIHTYIHYIHTFVCIYIYTYIHGYGCTCVCRYTYTYTYLYVLSKPLREMVLGRWWISRPSHEVGV